jgi:type VI protein secretion system component VasF
MARPDGMSGGCIVVPPTERRRRDMFWDDLIRRWRRDTGSVSPRLLRAAAGHVAVLPTPKPRQRLRVPWLFLIALGIAAIVLLLSGGQVQAVLAAIPL